MVQPAQHSSNKSTEKVNKIKFGRKKIRANINAIGID